MREKPIKCLQEVWDRMSLPLQIKLYPSTEVIDKKGGEKKDDGRD